MERLKLMLNKYRHIIALFLILCVSAAVLGWVGYSSLPDASSRSEREIVNDDYSVLTEDITDSEGIRQNIFVKGGSSLYGVSVNFHIFDRVQFGTVYVNVEDAQGNILSSAQRDMTTILDNTFKGFIFDNALHCAEDTDYVLHIGIQPHTAEDRVALWKSEKSYDGFALSENGKSTRGTIALQYYTRHVGNDAYRYFALVSSIVVAGLVLAYMLIFVKKAKIHNIFAVIALTVGIIFCLFTPINGGPDEYVHVGTAYRMSNEWLGVENVESGNHIRVRRCDAIMDYSKPVEYNPFSFSTIMSGLGARENGETEYIETAARFVKTFKPMYFAQTLGITFARVMKLGFVPMYMMGRLFNLLFYTAIIWLAIRIMPLHKVAMAICALLPMSMQLAGSYSYDVYIIAFSMLFIASVFRLTYSTEEAKPLDYILPLVSLCILAPAKTIYFATGALVFIIPDKKFRNRFYAWGYRLGVLAIAMVFWLSVNMARISGILGSKTIQREPDLSALENKSQYAETLQVEHTDEVTDDDEEPQRLYPYALFMIENPQPEEELFWDPEGDLLPNGDSKYYFSLSYIVTHIKQTVKLVINTFTHKSGHLLQCLIGTRLGEIIVVDLQASWLWLMAIVAVIVLSVTRTKETQPVHTGVRKWWGALIFLGIGALVVRASVVWTPINYEIMFGLQGRYLLPPFVLLVMLFENSLVTLEKNIDRALLYSMLCLDIMVILDVFIQIAAR